MNPCMSSRSGPDVVGIRQFEFEVMHLRETRELNWIEPGDVFPVALEQLRQYVAPFTVARRPRRPCVTARNDLEFGKRRRAREVLVGINIDVRRMVDRS